ncbi:MAG TPA: DUF1499 domain-containing protein [Gemmatimonadota bacterium]|nr:DUF1499 domain-containing protein [Gemmatimonadota bacterium]
MKGRIALLGFALAVAAALAAVASGLGARAQAWDFRAGFQILRWAAWGGLAAAALSLLGLGLAIAGRRSAPRGRALLLGALGLVVGLVVAWVPWSWKQRAERVPPIHDITTDLADPPVFEAILPLRRDAPNPSEYGGDSIAAQQREGYPDLVPLTLDTPPDAAFLRALEAVSDMGWEIVESDPNRGRIEATATTPWFGFKDDVVVRVRSAPEGSRVDVRSVSRVGRSDVGTNARRIRDYLEMVEAGD